MPGPRIMSTDKNVLKEKLTGRNDEWRDKTPSQATRNGVLCYYECIRGEPVASRIYQNVTGFFILDFCK